MVALRRALLETCIRPRRCMEVKGLPPCGGSENHQNDDLSVVLGVGQCIGGIMSLTSRARQLALLTNWSHQRCINELRAVGAEASDLADAAQWSVQRAEVFLIDPRFDAEYAEVSQWARYVEEHDCDSCGTRAFHGLDKKGTHVSGSLQFCPECVGGSEMWHCSRCGGEVLGQPGDGEICSNCWNNLMNRD